MKYIFLTKFKASIVSSQLFWSVVINPFCPVKRAKHTSISRPKKSGQNNLFYSYCMDCLFSKLNHIDKRSQTWETIKEHFIQLLDEDIVWIYSFFLFVCVKNNDRPFGMERTSLCVWMNFLNWPLWQFKFVARICRLLSFLFLFVIVFFFSTKSLIRNFVLFVNGCECFSVLAISTEIKSSTYNKINADCT
jgi:hypothetical protein